MQVIATAGHVDHGKSTLLRALTGMDPDRWSEEKRRGLTIDLGFAWLKLPSGERIAFVDVPGHERFVPNMLAGVGPVPAVLFMVAADEGWMPQSAEHLAVVDALGIRSGLLVITRSDLADPGPALAQASAELSRSSLGVPPAIAVSAVTGDGLADLVAAIDQLAQGLPVPDHGGPVRLWVDRAFTMTGSGTVVTGTLPGGTVHRGDELVVTPSMRPVRVRDIQTLGESAPAATGVARVALNLRGVSQGQPGPRHGYRAGRPLDRHRRHRRAPLRRPGGPGPPGLQRRPGHAAAAHRDPAHRLGPDRGQGPAAVRRHRPAEPARPAAAARRRPGAAARPGRGPHPAPPPGALAPHGRGRRASTGGGRGGQDRIANGRGSSGDAGPCRRGPPAGSPRPRGGCRAGPCAVRRPDRGRPRAGARRRQPVAGGRARRDVRPGRRAAPS